MCFFTKIHNFLEKSYLGLMAISLNFVRKMTDENYSLVCGLYLG